MKQGHRGRWTRPLPGGAKEESCSDSCPSELKKHLNAEAENTLAAIRVYRVLQGQKILEDTTMWSDFCCCFF